MANQTVEQFKAALASCNFNDPKAVSDLVTASYTEVAFADKVIEKQVKNPLGAYNYFGGLFGKEVWQDGQGEDMVREFYVDPHIPFSFSYFIKKMSICDPNLANECDFDYCEVPEGGRGTLPPMQWFKWGFETKRDCIASIRHIKQFRYWAQKVIRSRELIDEQVMNMFYVMAAIKTAGHKHVLQGYRDAAGQLRLTGDTNPRNSVRGGIYNYMQDKFPQPTNLQDLVPLTVDVLDDYARNQQLFPRHNHAATGPRGEPIWEFWYPDDWYQAEAIRNPDYMEKLKHFMPANLFAGYALNPGQREIIGNFAVKVMPFLPRFAPTATGEIVPVDTHVGVDIEVGKEYLGSIDFENAPIGIACQISARQGTILTKPDLTTSGAGFPIMPISGNSPWRIRNDYDKDCNKHLNKPYSEKNYEMGFRMDDPDAASVFMFRRRVFNRNPVNDCDLAPMFFATNNDPSCAITTIGCQAGSVRESNSIVQSPIDMVHCTAASCGNGLSAPFLYIIKVERKANEPGFNSLCECGASVDLFVYDEDGVYNRNIVGVVKDTSMGFPHARYFIETQTALAPGECIRGVKCADNTPNAGNVIDIWDIEDEIVGVVLDSPLSCGVSDPVVIEYFDSTGASLGTFTATITEFNPDTLFYQLTSADLGFKAEAFVGQATVSVTCD